MIACGNKTLFLRIVCFALVLIFCVGSLFSCENSGLKNGAQDDESEGENKVPLITLMKLESEDSVLFDTVNKAVSQAADENGAFYNLYEITGKSDEDVTNALFDAASENADLIICVGGAFYLPIDEVAPIYSEVNFLSVGAGNHSYKNVSSIEYADGEAGFIAGYIAVSEGFRKLGFVGSMEVSSVVSSGYGFLQGVDYAAKKLGVTDEISVNYVYTGSYTYSDYGVNVCSRWYDDGTQIVFTNGIGSAMSADKALNGDDAYVIAYATGENTSLSAETFYIDFDYGTVIRGIVSSFVTNGCGWSEEVAGAAFKLDAADGIFKYENTATDLFDSDLVSEGEGVLFSGEYILSSYEENDDFPEVDFDLYFYDEE